MYLVLKIFSALVIFTFTIIGVLVTVVFFGMQYGVFNVPGSIINRNASFGPVPTTTNPLPNSIGCQPQYSQIDPCEWNETVEWAVVKGGLEKDAPIINKVAKETGVSARLIASGVIPEQLRFFAEDNNREIFKRYFEPLKLLVSLSKFSLGVSGIKQDTATMIEEYANDQNSDFYPGDEIAPLLSYPNNTNHDRDLFNRLTDEKNHYYSYLYTAIFLKEIINQWQKEGFDIRERPDVLVTLFNLGFSASLPKENPQVAGADIKIGGQNYSFGHLGTLFYQSDELGEILRK